DLVRTHGSDRLSCSPGWVMVEVVFRKTFAHCCTPPWKTLVRSKFSKPCIVSIRNSRPDSCDESASISTMTLQVDDLRYGDYLSSRGPVTCARHLRSRSSTHFWRKVRTSQPMIPKPWQRLARPSSLVSG